MPGAAAASVGSFAMAVQPNGKIVVAGGSGRVGGEASGPEFGAVVRYRRDGSLDRSFGGGDGVALLRQLKPFTAVALQPDGKIIVTSPIGGEGGLARLLPDGGLDPSFGTGGVLHAGAATAYFPTSVALGGDGSIFVGGMSGYPEDPGEHWYGRLYRIAPDGRSGEWIGSMTGGDGRPGEPKSFLNDFVIGDDLTIVGAGTVVPLKASSQAALARLVPGQTAGPYPAGPDPSFGGGTGLVTPSFLAYQWEAEANAIAWQRAKLLIAGRVNTSLVLARYSAQGILDTGFGSKGLVTTLAGDRRGPAVANDLVVERRGGILVAGSSVYGCGGKGCTGLLLAAYGSDGRPDSRFGASGLVSPRVNTRTYGTPAGETGYDVALRREGKVLVGGLVAGPGSSRFFLRGYRADGKPDPGFGQGGRVTTLPLVAGTPAPGSGR